MLPAIIKNITRNAGLFLKNNQILFKKAKIIPPATINRPVKPPDPPAKVYPVPGSMYPKNIKLGEFQNPLLRGSQGLFLGKWFLGLLHFLHFFLNNEFTHFGTSSSNKLSPITHKGLPFRRSANTDCYFQICCRSVL